MKPVLRRLGLVALLVLASLSPMRADNTAQTLPFSQNWTNIGLITANDNWSGVPGIEGFRGDGLTGATGTDPQTLLAADDPGVLDVNANQTNPNTFTTGGATEFHLTDPVVALAGSGTATAPYVRLYLNTTGQTGITVAYNVRDIDGSTDNAVQQLALHYRVGSSGAWTNVPAAYLADASTGPSLATLVTPVCVVLPAAVNNQALVQVRIMTSNAVGNDEWLGIDDLVVNTAGCGAPLPNLSINDVAVTEGNAGTVTAMFTVSLSAPAGAGGVTFDITTADNTATLANNDYVMNTLTGQTIPAGSSTYNFNVTVNGDVAPEANEIYFVNVTNVTGANVTDGQGQGTINNDDVAITPIHDVQGPGASSPIVGASVTVRGIVTGVRSNGFFVQEEEADYDADPATSEGVLVFVGAAPPAAAALGNLVQVTGTVTEFVPTQDPLQPPLTELTSPTVVLISSGNPLPAPVALSAAFPSPAGVHDQLERHEGMRVSLASLTVSGPTLGSINETNATATSQGVFYGVATGNARPFREAGIQAPDPPPAGSIPPIPRFDSNPERIRVDSDGLVGGVALDLGAGAVVTGLVGPLDYTFRTYTILPDPATPPSASGGPTVAAVTAPTGKEVTVAGYNMQRFFDTVNDPAIGEPVLTTTAFNNRLAKASLGIRDFLRFPDIVGVVEVENLTTLQAVAARISVDALANSQPDPLYQAFLVEGNDVGGIDVGFLVKSSLVTGSTPRVTVNSVTQFGLTTTITNPDSSTELLNDRPPLVLDAVVNHANGASFPLVVIVNHMRSLNGNSDPTAPGPNGWATVGDRVRNKRLQQAVFLANLVQARQTSNPAERIVMVGDFNAFEVNDGLVDMMNVLGGTPPPDNETAVPGDGIDLVNPDFTNLISTAPAAERYSFIFDGNAQNLDHALINSPMIGATSARREEHARINADFPEVARNNTTNVERLADHDPVVVYLEVPAFCTADLAITKTDSPDPVAAGASLSYTIVVGNNGPDPAATVAWSDTLPAGTTFVSLAAPGGWTCSTPAVGAGGMVTCSIAALANGASENFTLVVAVASSTAAGTMLSNTATVSSATADGTAGNNSATATTTVAGSADTSLTKTADPNPVVAGTNLTYTLTVSNEGPSDAATLSLSDPLPAGTTFVSLSVPGGWSCSTPAVGANGTITCGIATFPAGSAVFTVVVAVDPAVADATVLTNTATLTAATGDPNPGDTVATTNTTVSAVADLSITKVDRVDPVAPGQDLAYTITATSAGPSAAVNATWSDTLPAGTTFQSLTSPPGWTCSTPAVGGTGTVTCSLAAFLPGAFNFTLVVNVDATVAGGTTIDNTATLSSPTTDPDTADLSAGASSTVSSPAAISATKTVSGDFRPGGLITYTIVISNAGPAIQGDNPGDELTDSLPAELVLESASASSGTATTAGNTVSWNGSIPAASTVTITIEASIPLNLTPGTEIVNQATVNYDGDGNGTNEAAGATDDPNVGGTADPTAFGLGGGAPDIPTLDTLGFAALAALLTLVGLARLRRRRAVGRAD